MGTLAYVPERVGWYACLMQGASSISTYFFFKSSDDILKFFAACRFFEIYFIAPHLVGAVYSRFVVCKVSSLRQPTSVIHALFGRVDGLVGLTDSCSLWTGAPAKPCGVWSTVAAKPLHEVLKKTGPVDTKHNSLSTQAGDFFKGLSLIMMSTMLVGAHLATVFYIGQASFISTLIIYVPLSVAVLFMLRDGVSNVMVVSSVVAIGHGFAHKFYPFLDSEVGVNHEVDVWQDQILHAFQGVIFSYIFWQSSGRNFKILCGLFVTGLVLNVMIAKVCWNTSCYEAYVWFSLIPATASGLHFAIGSVAHTPERVGWYACVLQGCSAICTFFYFRSSDDVLKFFAACRFFEIYFIVPHLVGIIYGRLSACDFAPIRQPSLWLHTLFGRIDASTKLDGPNSLWTAPPRQYSAMTASKLRRRHGPGYKKSGFKRA